MPSLDSVLIMGDFEGGKESRLRRLAAGDALERGLAAAGRYLVVRMLLDDRPGSLATISRIIAESDANVTGVDHTRVGGSISMGDVAITINMETKGHEHCEKVLQNLRAEGFHPVVLHG